MPHTSKKKVFVSQRQSKTLEIEWVSIFFTFCRPDFFWKALDSVLQLSLVVFLSGSFWSVRFHSLVYGLSSEVESHHFHPPIGQPKTTSNLCLRQVRFDDVNVEYSRSINCLTSCFVWFLRSSMYSKSSSSWSSWSSSSANSSSLAMRNKFGFYCWTIIKVI